MLGRAEIERIRSLVEAKAPVLSLYVALREAEAAPQGSKKKPYLIRAKETMKRLGVPEALAARVLERLEHDAPEALTRAIFAGEDFLEVFDLGVLLPVVDPVRGLVEARYGEPYLAPLLLALDEYERYAVVLLDRERWRVFEVFMGEIREALDAFRAVDPEAWRRLSEAKPGTPQGVQARGGTATDKFDRRLMAWTHRFYKALAAELERWLDEVGASRVILMGVAEETRYFETFLSKAARRKVVGHVGAPGGSRVPASAVLERVRPLIEAVEREEEMRLLDAIREKGVWGVGPVLEALGRGQVHVLAVPWDARTEVFYCPDQQLAGVSPEALSSVCKDPEKRLLKEIVADLALAWGARIEFMRGESGARLEEEFGGLAALLRW